MTYKRLLKILEGDSNVSELSEENIAEYKQAKQSIEAFNHWVISPVKEFARGKNEILFDSKDVQITAKQIEGIQKHPDKTLLTLLDSHLRTAELNHSRGKQAYGVRTFEQHPAIDAKYMFDVFQDWQAEELGTSVSDKVYVSGGKDIAKNHMGRLATVFAQEYNIGESLTPDQAALYITAATQVDALQKRIVKPFENAFKALVEEKDEMSVIRKPYGGLIVQVKDIPRVESDYKSGVQATERQLGEYAELRSTQVDNINTFFNADLTSPRAYVHIPTLRHMVQDAQQTTAQKHKKEIAILYKPEDATILAA